MTPPKEKECCGTCRVESPYCRDLDCRCHQPSPPKFIVTQVGDEKSTVTTYGDASTKGKFTFDHSTPLQPTKNAVTAPISDWEEEFAERLRKAKEHFIELGFEELDKAERKGKAEAYKGVLEEIDNLKHGHLSNIENCCSPNTLSHLEASIITKMKGDN